jgi:hypothetical protein
MAISDAMAADLRALAEATADEDGVDLRASLNDLCRSTDVAVRGFLGLALTVDHPAGQVTLTALRPAAETTAVTTSLHMVLSQCAGGEPESTVTLFARLPGAFDLLAGDLKRLSPQHGRVSSRDAHLRLPPEAERHSVAQLSIVNQAVGILIARGWTLDDAREELRRRAFHDGVAVPASAQRIIDTASGAGSVTRAP